MAYMVEDFYRPGAVMEFPKGGSAELIGALERGVTKHAGSSVLTSTPVEEVLVEDGRAVGVRVSGGPRCIVSWKLLTIKLGGRRVGA